MNLLSDTPSILPVNGAGKEVSTILGKEIELHCVADYARSLASSSRI